MLADVGVWVSKANLEYNLTQSKTTASSGDTGTGLYMSLAGGRSCQLKHWKYVTPHASVTWNESDGWPSLEKLTIGTHVLTAVDLTRCDKDARLLHAELLVFEVSI